MINSVIPQTPSLTHLHSLSLFLSLPWCPTTTMSSHCSHTTCALIPFHPSHTSHLTRCPTTTKYSHTLSLMFSHTTCALIVIPHTQVILPTDHSHTLSLIISLSDLTTSSHQLYSFTLSLMFSFSPSVLSYQLISPLITHTCYPHMFSLTSGHSLPWCHTITNCSLTLTSSPFSFSPSALTRYP